MEKRHVQASRGDIEIADYSTSRMKPTVMHFDTVTGEVETIYQEKGGKPKSTKAKYEVDFSETTGTMSFSVYYEKIRISLDDGKLSYSSLFLAGMVLSTGTCTSQ